MKGLHRAGDYLFEFLVITVIVTVAACTVLFFFPVIVGLAGYFKEDIEGRRLRDIFTTIGRNWKIIIFYTIFQLIIIFFPLLNIYYFNTHIENLNGFVLAVSYIALIVGIFYMTTAPTIIVNMNVKFRQLLYNGIMLLFGGLWRSIAAVALVAAVVLIIIYYPYILILTLYAFPYINSKLMGENFLKLKAKAQGTTVEELKRKRGEDDYLDEYGNIKRTQKTVSGDGDNKDE